MSDRHARRGTQLVLDAEQLDNNASKARNSNKRARNRLLLAKNNLDGQRENNMNSIKYEMRQLENQLRDVKQSSGYMTLKNEKNVSPAKRKAQKEATKSQLKGSQRMKLNANSVPDEQTSILVENVEKKREGDERRGNVNLPLLQPSAIQEVHSHKSQKNSTVSLSLNERETDCNIPTEHNRKVNLTEEMSLNPYANSNKLSKPELELHSKANTEGTETPTPHFYITVPLKSVGLEQNGKKDDTNHQQKSRIISKPENSLGNLSFNAAKDRIQSRFSISPESAKQEKPLSTPYLYAPPDSLPRTLYLLPPVEELFKEARKARYIRKYRRPKEEIPHDDPERELGIDEIFGREKEN